MTPKDKAIELVSKFREYTYDWPKDNKLAKKAALLCINEMLVITPMYTGDLNPMWDFLRNVKKEIELL